MIRTVGLSLAIAAVGACSTLPRDGPTNRAIETAAAEASTFDIVELDYAASEVIRTSPPAAFSSLALMSSEAPTDVIEIGDTLSVSIFEPGGAVFGGGAAGAAGAPAVATQALPPLIVNRDGTVTIAFAGPVRVAGMTPQQAEQQIRRALTGRLVSPQVIVAAPESPSNGVTVLGSVASPGRVPLSPNAPLLLDVIANAGGASGPAENITVTVTRRGRSASAPLMAVYANDIENIRLERGDLVNLVSQPRRFSSFGALGAITLTEMPTGDVSLTSALSSLGGLNDAAANARSVLVFRFERPEVAARLGVSAPGTPRGVPVVYRLNLADPEGFFTANNFLVQSEDVIYVPRADFAEMRKFFETVQALTRIVYDVRVASALGED
ncbi:polysaccharide biosynthesis/export family protein [Brevundimonas balnearis]|uniref:Polysaccharide biosynthesis/export family protein n=1 Tax=Brevundimonas balnearis TaxID=1572858 RepID=A0ABV6QYH9_9CAUL